MQGDNRIEEGVYLRAYESTIEGKRLANRGIGYIWHDRRYHGVFRKW